MRDALPVVSFIRRSMFIKGGKGIPFRTHWIGANPEKSDLVNSVVQTEENLVNSVLCCFSLGKNRQNAPKTPA